MIHNLTLQIMSTTVFIITLTFAGEAVNVKVSLLHLEHLSCAGSSARVAGYGCGRRSHNVNGVKALSVAVQDYGMYVPLK